MPAKKTFLILFVFSLLIYPALSQSLSFRIAKIKVPPYTQITVEGARVNGNLRTGNHTLYFPKNFKFPFTLKAYGPLGGVVVKEISSPRELANLKFETGIISLKKANPKSIPNLPRLCPRLTLVEEIAIASNEPSTTKYEFVYDGAQDRLNHIPISQLLDPDAGKKSQYKTFSEMDGNNVLLLQKVEVKYDYEDTAIIDYEGPHPITGKEQIINEGEGGFYANIHYAILPYDKKILEMDRQTLLHLVQGKLKEIDKEGLRPEIRTHSFIPGPFLSKTNQIYDMCEWGDTAYQAPHQILHYKEMALWDWDYSIKNADHVLLIVWEGDEEDWLYESKLIHPFHLTDDLIGLFEIKKKDTEKPLTLTNEKGDFTMVVQTGNLKIPPNGK